jgi:glycosyltransferase involved in cell wall biosynthesis
LVHLIRAMAALREQGRDPAVVIVGGHSFQDYQQYRDDALALIDRVGLRQDRDVFEVGTLADEELHTWYRAADALVFPSINEGWGLAVLEAMAAELPVVTSDIPVLREYLTDRVNAIMTATGDPADLARGMAAVMDDAALREKLRAAGTDLVGTFTWDGAAAQHQHLYESLMGQRRG